jgi:hypothetical protein
LQFTRDNVDVSCRFLHAGVKSEDDEAARPTLTVCQFPTIRRKKTADCAAPTNISAVTEFVNKTCHGLYMFVNPFDSSGARGGALRYKSEGRGFDFQWSHWNFSLP